MLAATARPRCLLRTNERNAENAENAEEAEKMGVGSRALVMARPALSKISDLKFESRYMKIWHGNRSRIAYLNSMRPLRRDFCVLLVVEFASRDRRDKPDGRGMTRVRLLCTSCRPICSPFRFCAPSGALYPPRQPPYCLPYRAPLFWFTFCVHAALLFVCGVSFRPKGARP